MDLPLDGGGGAGHAPTPARGGTCATVAEPVGAGGGCAVEEQAAAALEVLPGVALPPEQVWHICSPPLQFPDLPLASSTPIASTIRICQLLHFLHLCCYC